MIGDWMKDPTFLAEAGHTLAGWLAPLLFFLFRGRRGLAWGLGLFVLYAAVKEFYIDLRFESDETWISSLLDFAFYMGGLALAWATVKIRAFAQRLEGQD